MIYVAASDLIPEVNRREKGIFTSILVIVGAFLFYLIEWWLSHLGL
jgi:hypothetical protein